MTAGSRSSVAAKARVEIRYDVIHGEGMFRQVAKLGELAAELVRWTVPGAEAAERAGVGDRRGQLGRREDAHPRLDDGNLDPYEVTQWRTHTDHLHPAKSVAANLGQSNAPSAIRTGPRRPPRTKRRCARCGPRWTLTRTDDVTMEIMRRVVVFDAADLAAESAFWAGMLGGRVLADDRWHSVFDADGRWVIGVQLAPDHNPPEWPDGNRTADSPRPPRRRPRRAHAEAVALGARLLQGADDLTAAEGHQVYADPAGHPFCLGWGQPDDDAVRRYLRDRPS